MKLIFSLLAFAWVLSTLAHAQQRPQPLKEIVNNAALRFINEPQHVGLSIGIVKDGKTYYYNYGTIEKGKQILPASNTIYEIGSVTKSFTGILLAHAILEKKLSPNDDIRKYLDGPYPNLVFEGHPIRIIDLANHTAGFDKNIPDIPPGLSVDQILEFYKGMSENRFLQELAKVKLNVMPGTTFSYSNAGAQLAGIILEKVYHTSYAGLVKKYISRPNSMNDTEAEVNPNDFYRYAKGYDEKGTRMPELVQWRTIPAAGYLKSTVRDLLKYAQLNMNEKDPAIALSHQVTFKNTAEGNADIGLFWFTRKSPKGYRQVLHAGGGFGTTSYCLIYPDLKTGVVILTNDASPGTEHEIKQMADEILDQSGLDH
jgi:D-alanyl-D-alanine-carboxypeptidase/D-alanyl-D-alanine-endopeptidase